MGSKRGREERHDAPSSDGLGQSGPGTPGYEGATAIGEEGASAWHGEQDALEEGGPLTGSQWSGPLST